MQAVRKSGHGRVRSAAVMAGAAAILELACQSQAGQVFNDTFGTSTINGDTNVPTATSTNYDFLSTKDSTLSNINANILQGKLAAGTTSGGWEAEALFSTAPITLLNAGDSIEETMVFVPTNIVAGGTSSTLGLGLFNSHGSAPTNSLSNAGLSTATGSSFATGFAQPWEGYVGIFAATGGTNKTYVRPVQDGTGTSSANQEVLFSKAGSGFFTNPAATNVTQNTNTGITLTDGNTYTNDLKLTLNADGSVTVAASIYNGNTTSGSLVGAITGSVPSAAILTFDALAFGAFNKGTSLDPQLDISSLTISTAAAATLTGRTWDPGLTTTGSDGSGNWTTSNAIWAASGADGAWVNDGTSTATFGAGGAAGTVTITDPNINAAGINFNGGYTIAANPGSTLTMTAAAVTVASGQTATVTAPIAGNVGVSVKGGGSLVLGGPNTYTGNTTIADGTLVVNAGSSMGDAANGLVVGTTGVSTDPSTTSAGALILNANATVGTLTVATNNTTPNTIAINGSSVLTVNGVASIGLASSASPAPTTALTVTGNELHVNNTLNIGAASTAARGTTIVDLSGLSTFVMNATGTGQAFNFGAAQSADGTVTLASTANTITTNTINVSVATSNSGVDTLNLGAGTNVLNASNINIGVGKGVGVVQFAGASGSVTIAGITGGDSTANITVGSQTTGTAGSGVTSTFPALNLNGHVATVQANTMIVGQLAGASAGTAQGSVLFDTGNMTVASLQIANNSNGTAANGITGIFTLGGTTPNDTATGVLNVTSQFTLANATNPGATANVANGTFIVNGGVANINSDIVVGQAPGIVATTNTTLQLAGGTLNMMGHAIGPVADGVSVAINTVTLPGAGQTATIANLGGTGINNAGVTMNGQGTLNLGGTNTYSGGTNVSSGTVAVTGSLGGDVTIASGAAFVVQAGGSVSAASVLTNSGTLTFNNAMNTVASISNSAGSIVQLHGAAVKTGAFGLAGGAGAWTSGLDIGVGKLILQSANNAADATQFREQVKFGATGAPNGIFSTSLPSNFAIAVLDNAVLHKATFGGLPVDSSSVMVAAEMLGDSNVDGKVDLTDLSTVLNNFGTTTAAWTSGNFDGAATIDLTDLSDVLNNFGLTNPNASAAPVSMVAAAPEPASLAVLGVGALAAVRRRRRSA
ncbi:MAG: beta strand repeat-containing protein [Phycisphaerae bacterium]